MTDEERARARRDSQLIRLASVLLNEFGASEALPGIETAIYMLRALRKRAEQAEAELKAAREDNARLTHGIAKVAYDLDQADNPASATDLRDLLAENTDGITVAETWRLAAEDAQAERDVVREENGRLRRLLALAAIPLEALYASEQDGAALCAEVKQGIADAVREIRAEFAGGPR